MRVNVEKVLERDQKLSELDHRADALQHGASQFEQQAGKLKRKQWWANMKMMIIMGIIGVVLLIIIIGELALRFAFVSVTNPAWIITLLAFVNYNLLSSIDNQHVRSPYADASRTS